MAPSIPHDRYDGLHVCALRPLTARQAAIWWMAERASHVRVSMLHQWQYELDHGADVTASVTVLAREGSREGVGEGSRGGMGEGSREGVGAPSGAPAVEGRRRASGSRRRYEQHTILSWMRRRLSDQRHSTAGHRAVYQLLVAHGAPSDGPFRPVEAVHDLADEAQSEDDDDGSGEGSDDEWTTDDEAEEELAARRARGRRPW